MSVTTFDVGSRAAGTGNIGGPAVAVLGKGGTGKTTTTATLGGLIAAWGARVLLVDLDSTATLTAWLAAGHDGATVDDVLAGRASFAEACVPVRERLTVLAGSSGLARIEGEPLKGVVAEMVERARAEHDLVLLDLRGGTASRLAAAAVAAAGAALVTMEPSPMGTTPLREARQLCDQLGTPLLGVLPIRGSHARVSRQLLDVLAAAGWPMWAGIRQDITTQEAVAARRPIDEYAPDSRAVGDYTAAARRLIEVLGLPTLAGQIADGGR